MEHWVVIEFGSDLSTGFGHSTDGAEAVFPADFNASSIDDFCDNARANECKLRGHIGIGFYVVFLKETLANLV